MATDPQFAATPLAGVANISAANTNRDGSGSLVTVVTAGASGAKIEEIVVKAEDNPADGVIIIWIDTGGTAFMYDEIDMGDGVDATNTEPGVRFVKTYTNLVLKAGWILQATLTVAPTAGDVNVWAFGGDY